MKKTFSQYLVESKGSFNNKDVDKLIKSIENNINKKYKIDDIRNIKYHLGTDEEGWGFEFVIDFEEDREDPLGVTVTKQRGQERIRVCVNYGKGKDTQTYYNFPDGTDFKSLDKILGDINIKL